MKTKSLCIVVVIFFSIFTTYGMQDDLLLNEFRNTFLKYSPVKKKKNTKKKIKIKKQKPIHKFFFSYSMNFSPSTFIFIPWPENLWYGAATLDLAWGLEYKMYEWLGFQWLIGANGGINYQHVEYFRNSCTYCPEGQYKNDLIMVNLFIQHMASLKFYLKKDYKFKNSINRYNIFFRIGLTFEWWLFSYFWFFENSVLQATGDFLDNNTSDIMNLRYNYVNHRSLFTQFYLGGHFGIGFNIFQKKKYSIFQPEFRFSFFFLPNAYGGNENQGIQGYDMPMLRNNGTNDTTVIDFKMQVSFCLGFNFEIQTPPIITKIVLSNLRFYPNSSKLLPESKKKLDRFVTRLKKAKYRRIHFEGHTARIKNRDVENKLSIRRAAAVRNYLLAKGAIWKSNSSYSGKGSSEPLASSRFELGRKKNRRVIIFIYR